MTTKGVTSDVHIDATGLATRIYVVKGVKLWLVAVGEHIPHPVDGWQTHGLWKAVVLRAGDELYVLPSKDSWRGTTY